MTRNKEIKLLKKYATYAIYKLYCNGCESEAPGNEYPTYAAQEAWEEGYRLVKVKERALVFCAACIEKEAWKEWKEISE